MEQPKACYAYIPTECLEDVLYKTTSKCVAYKTEIEKLNSKVTELVDKIATLTAKNRVLEDDNKELKKALEEAHNDGTF